MSQSNHKEGPYNSPSKVFPENPYTNQVLPATYSSTSSILNIDTFSLSNEPQGLFTGWIESGMVLIGSTSGAQATITNIRLVSDLSATLIGSLFIPNPNSNIHPRFESGTKSLTFINNTFNDQNFATTIAEENFSSSGTLETVHGNIISVRNARIESRVQIEEKQISRSTGTQVVSSTALSSSSSSVTNYPPQPSSGFVLRPFIGPQGDQTGAAIGLAGIDRARAEGRSNAEIISQAQREGLGFGAAAARSLGVKCYKDPLAQSFIID